MFRVILFISLFPIALALGARWWFGVRVLATMKNTDDGWLVSGLEPI